MKYFLFLILVVTVWACKKQSAPQPAVDVEVMVYATPFQDTTTVLDSTRVIELQVR